MIAPDTNWKGIPFSRASAGLAPKTNVAARVPTGHGSRDAITPSAPEHAAPAAEIPAYRIHRTKGLGYVRLQGRMIYLGKANSADSLERYRRLVGEWLVSGRVSVPKEKSEVRQLTVGGMVNGYLDWTRRYYVDGDGKTTAGLGPVRSAAKILTELYGPTLASEFGPVALKALRQAMLERGLCRNVVNQRVGCVKRIFRWAVGEQLIPPAVMQALSAVEPLRVGRSAARETEPVRPVRDAHVDAVLPFLPPTVVAMVRLQRLTGMRSGELCIMRTCDVDTSKGAWLYRPAQHKTAYRGHERVVRIGPKGQAVLGPFLRPLTPAAYIFSPIRASRERKLLQQDHRAERLIDEQGIAWTNRYKPRSYNRALHYAMKKAANAVRLAEKDFWHPHQLRHRHATEIRQTKGLEAARVLLGHRTLSQTLEYAEADARVAEALASELG